MTKKTFFIKTIFTSQITLLSFFFLLLISVLLYLWVLFSPLPSDLAAHNHILYSAIQSGEIIIPPLYYYGVWFFGHLLVINPSYKFGALLILSFAVVWKYFLTLKFFYNETKKEYNNTLLQLSFLSLSLMFVFPLILPFLDGKYWYLGKFTPTIWHNSTSVLVLPMCMIMYFEARKWLQSAGSISSGFILLWGFLILLTKPSFLFVFIPAFPIAWLFYHRAFTRGFWITIFISCLLLTGVWLEKSLIYQESAFGDWVYRNSDSAKVEIKPFLVFLSLSDSIVWDLFSSFLFLGILITILWAELKHRPEFWWNLTMLFGGMILYFTVVESGNRLLHGNFYWQIPISLYLLLLLLISQLIRSKVSTGKKLVLWTVYSLQVISGIAYLIRWILTGTNY